MILLLGTYYSADAATFSSVKVPLCGYGLYRYGSECLPVDVQAEKCPTINGLGSYRVSIDSNTFMYQSKTGLPCQGTHTLYTYDDSVLATMSSGGTMSAVGAPMCGYDQYRLNNKCYNKTDKNATGSCPDDFHKTNSDSASFMSLHVNGNVCLGSYTLYEHLEQLHPLYNGILLSVGAPLHTASDMRGTPCSVNSDEYYKIAVATEDTFTHPDLGTCPTTSAKFVVNTDCKDINTSDKNALAANPTCGVLCDSGVYTNSGICATGYCEHDGKHRRLFYKKNDTTFSIPLYASPTTTPSINIKYNNDQICYMNLIPSDVTNTIHIKHENATYSGID